MLYRVLMDGTDILDFTEKDLVLLSPQVTMEIDTAGSFEFTVPPSHRFYDRFFASSIMTMTIEVLEGDILHFFGRPMEFHLDFYKNKKIYCEGALSFFNDSVIREAEYDDLTLGDVFSLVIGEHNSMVPANRRFSVGNFTVTNGVVYRKFNYEQTSDVLKSKFLDAVDGHFFVRRENGVNYIDLLKDMPYTCNQNVKFAENLLNFTYSFDGKDFATCVIPLGGNDQDSGKPIDISSINGGSDILIGAAAENYGNIVKVQQYNDIKDPTKLVTEGQKYLTNLQWNAFLIECSAVDLHATDATKQQFRIGQIVHCVSDPHGITMDLPISKMTLYLDSAAKQITLGRIPKKTLSRFYKENTSGRGPGSGDEVDSLPDGYDIIDDPITGDPTVIKVPVTMQIVTLPWRDGSQANSTYEYGDTLIFTGLTAYLVGKGQSREDDPSAPITYFSDANYPDGEIPFSELRFEPTTYNQHTGKIMCWAIWTNPRGLYNGYKTRKPFYMYSLTEAANEADNMPDHIAVTADGRISRTTYHPGQSIDYSGLVVRAYKPDGSLYTENGYNNGIIPLTELILPVKNVDDAEPVASESTSSLIDGLSVGIGSSGSINANLGSGNVGTGTFNIESPGVMTFIPHGGDRYFGIYASSQENTVLHYTGPTGSDQQDIVLNSQALINGRIVYYYAADGGPWIMGTASPSSSEELYNMSAVNIAWTMVYGDVSYGGKLIPISWKAPNGSILETSITINYESGE